MGIERTSHIVFAIVLIGWGVLGLVKGDFAPGWAPVPESIAARQTLAYLSAFLCVAVGIGLLWRRTAGFAARAFFFWLLIWLLLLRIPWMVVAFGIDHWWSASSTAIVTAAAWILYISLAGDWDRKTVGFFVSQKGLRIARLLFGVGLIPIGLAHFLYVEATAPLVPAWLLWPLFWAYFTGTTFIAAGVSIIFGVFARLAAMLVTLQIASMSLFVWLPLALAGGLTPFQWGEVEVSIVLTTCAWVVADSYRRNAWFTYGNQLKVK